MLQQLCVKNEGITFIDIVDHCTLAVQNKLESLAEFKEKEEEVDVAWLLEKIKEQDCNQ